MIDVFDYNIDFEVPDVDTQADNAIQWTNLLYKTTSKKNSKFLGNIRVGYSVLGIGHRLMEVPCDPHQISTKEFQLTVGLKTEKGAFDKAIKYEGKHYKSLYHVGLDLSFRRVAGLLRKAPIIRNVFKEDVAALIIKKTIKRGRPAKNNTPI